MAKSKVSKKESTVKKSDDYFEDDFHTAPSGRRTKPAIPEAMKNGRTRDVPSDPAQGMSLESFKLTIQPTRFVEFCIVGESPLLFNAPNPETISEIERKQQGEGRTKKGPRRPEREFLMAGHLISGEYTMDALPNNVYGAPAIAIKKSMLNASFRQGEEKNRRENMGSFFIHGPYDGLVSLDAPPPVMRTDVVKMPNGKLTPCYRPQFYPWECTFVVKYWENLCTCDDLMMWVHLSGQHCGLGSRRIENSGEQFGGFTIKWYSLKKPDFAPVYLRRKLADPEGPKVKEVSSSSSRGEETKTTKKKPKSTTTTKKK